MPKFAFICLKLGMLLLLVSVPLWATKVCAAQEGPASEWPQALNSTAVSPALKAMPAIKLDFPQISLGRQVFYLPADDSLSLKQALGSDGWQAYAGDIVNFGYTDTQYWLAFRLQSVPADAAWLLAIGYPLLDRVDVHILSEHGSSQMRLGDQLPFKERPVSHRQFLVPLAPSVSPVTVVIRVASVSSMQVPMAIITEQTLLEQDQQAQVGQGIYFGIMLAMLFYNLFLYCSIRDSNYLFYVASVICVALVQATLRGYSYQFLWPDSPLIQHYHMPVIVSLSGAFVAFFSIGFWGSSETVHSFSGLQASSRSRQLFDGMPEHV